VQFEAYSRGKSTNPLLPMTQLTDSAPFPQPQNMAFLRRWPVLFFGCDDVHRHEANYVQVVHVDYLDYD
jgi:hypothetical protein